MVTNHGPLSDTRVSDLYLYAQYHDLLHSGLVPFRDFSFEYPPVALAPIWLVGGDETQMSLLMLGCAIAGQLAAWSLGGPVAGWLTVALPVLAGALVRTHLDLLPAALTMVALALVVARPRGGVEGAAALLAIGTMAKLWPAAVGAVVLVWLVGRGEGRAAVRGAAVFVVVALAIGVPFAVLGGFPSVMVRFHLDRPVQIESTAASILEAVGGTHVTGHPVLEDRFKSNGLAGGPAGVVLTGTTLALGVVGLVLLALAHRRRTDRDLLLAAFGVTVAFVALGKVLSPQYLCWMLPPAAVVAARGAWVGPACVAAASALTQVWFPSRYFDIVFQHDWAVGAVAVRNALLLAALAATVAALARSPRPASAAPPPG
ncbi:glycosyltransferase 87 family protein [Baekduia soli]|uniref:glycosyltransferase 87 family protein n=1 Tax=Baekduia soli TaxID=496014 RepID=UPI0016520232|nr:glycosyltransferase 87 family protein [Baekduia soli]